MLKINNIKKAFFITLVLTQLFVISCNKSDDEYLTYYKKGQDSLEKKQNLDAVEYFNKAIESNPNHIDSYQSQAFSYIELRKYNEAEKILKIAISKSVDDKQKSSIYYGMFVLYSRQAKFDKAFEYLQKSLDAFRSNKEHNDQLSKDFIRLYSEDLISRGEIDKSYNVLLKSSQYYPDEYFSYAGLSYIEEKYYKNKDKAEKYLKKAKELGKDKIVRDQNLSLEIIRKSIVDPSTKPTK